MSLAGLTRLVKCLRVRPEAYPKGEHLKGASLRESPGANVIKLFTAVIYCHSMVISSFCVIKLYYLGNYHGMAVNYHGIKLFYNITQKVCFKC